MNDWSPDPRTLFMRVVDDIETQVCEGSIRPGQRLSSARQMADIYHVSTMTAQRALRELQVRGVTYAEAGRGTFVRPDTLPRLATTSRSDCSRCEEEASYTARLVAALGRCHLLAEELDGHTSPDVARIAAEVRRLASLLAGGLMDHAGVVDRSNNRHRHD